MFRELLTYMMSDPRTISACAHLLFVAKNLERIGDYATGVAEIIHYEVTGDDIEGDRPKWKWRPDGEGARRMTPYVLVVEDEDALATLLKYNLDKEGHHDGRRLAMAKKRW